MFAAPTTAAIPPSEAPMTTTLRAPSPRTALTAAATSTASRPYVGRPSEKPWPRKSKAKTNSPFPARFRANGSHSQRSPLDMCARTTAGLAPGRVPPKRWPTRRTPSADRNQSSLPLMHAWPLRAVADAESARPSMSTRPTSGAVLRIVCHH